jgi:hypothetical protein
VYDVVNDTSYLLSTGLNATYAYTDIDKVHVTQVGDSLFITGETFFPLIIRQTSSTNFLVNAINDGNFGYLGRYWLNTPYGPIQSLGIDGTITVTGTFTVGGSVTLTSTNNQFGDVDANGVYGTYFKFIDGTSTGIIGITSVTTATSAAGTVLKVIPGSSPRTFGSAAGTGFQKSRWSVEQGFPKTVAGFQGRLVFGGNIAYPNYLWGSKIGNIFVFSEVPDTDLASTVDPDFNFSNYAASNTRAFEFGITAGSTKQIRSLSAQKSLVINASTNEIVAFGSEGALGALDYNFETSTSYGSEFVQSVQCNNFQTFVQRGGRKLRDVIFNFNEDQYKSNDLQFVSDHLTLDGKIDTLVSAELLSSVLLARKDNGSVIVVTLDRDYQINAWSTFKFGGSYLSGDAQVVTMCAIPDGEDNGEDSIFFLIQRTVDGNTVRYLEKLSSFYEKEEYEQGTPDFFYYMDSYIEVNNSPAASTISGLGHLEGETVQVMADSFYLGEFTVTGGDVILPAAYTDVCVGLKYESKLIPTSLEFGAQTGNAMGREKRLDSIYLRFFSTLGAKYGYVRTGQYFDVIFRENSVPENEPTPLFTGDKYLKFPQGYDRTYEIEVKTDYPFPCNVVAIAGHGTTYD